MGQDLAYQMILPAGYSTTERRYPVIYWLHGLFGDYQNWTDLTGLVDYANDLELIVVTPDAKDSWYTDSATVKGEGFESYFLKEMIPAIESSYRIRRERGGRAIGGNSMGGYGAFKFALKRPDLFSYAVSFSGAFHAPNGADGSAVPGWNDLRESVMRVFGPSDSPTRIENDLFRMVEDIPHLDKADLPFLYFDCGVDDSFLGTNRALDRTLSDNNVRHEFRECAGGHDWEYWDGRIRDLLPVVSSELNAADRHSQG